MQIWCILIFWEGGSVSFFDMPDFSNRGNLALMKRGGIFLIRESAVCFQDGVYWNFTGGPCTLEMGQYLVSLPRESKMQEMRVLY